MSQNKYIQYYNQTEKQYLKDEKVFLRKKLREFIKIADLDYIKIKNIDEIYAVFRYINIIFSNLPQDLKTWVKKNLFDILSKKSLLGFYLMWLSDSLTKDNKTMMNGLMKSFKEIGLIKDITYNEGRKKYKLITLDNHEIYFQNIFDESELSYNIASRGHCHQCAYSFLNSHKDDKDVFGVSVIEKTLIDTPSFHSFVVKNNIMIDISHNMLMKYDDYKHLINSEIIIYCQANQIIKNIDRLHNKQKDFDNDRCYLLNYALHKHMKKHKL